MKQVHFLIIFLNISHVFYLYFHLILTRIYQLSQKGQHRWIKHFVQARERRVNLQGVARCR